MSASPSSPLIRAVVVTGDGTIPYCRAGRGRPVVLLADEPQLVASLLAEMPSCLSVFAPDLANEARVSSPPKLGIWIWGFLDALGVQRATFVVARKLAAELTEIIRSDAERVAGLVVVDSSSGPAEIARHIVDLSLSEASPVR
jgi:hypothetical protein